MANSSDWMAMVRASPHERHLAPPNWIAAIEEREGFRAHQPFGARGGQREQTEAPDEAEAQTEAIERAYAEGEAAGRAAADAEARASSAHQRALRITVHALDQAAMDALASDLAETVIKLCSAALADWVPDEESLTRRCAEAARRLGRSIGNCSLRLNPADLETLGEQPFEGWEVMADPAIERGGLVLEGPDGAVHDSPREWRRAIETAVRG